MIVKDSISQKYTIQLSERTYIDQDGYLICQDAIFGRIGTYKYLKKELGISSGNPNEIIDLNRKPEYVFDEDSLNSLEGRPLTLGHPNEKVNIENYLKYAKGFVQNVRHDDVNIIGDIRITDKIVKELVLSNKMRELSLGYDMTLCQEEDYSYYCKDIIYNHLALVEEGRAGTAMILDEKIEELKEKEVKNEMAEESKLVEETKVVEETKDEKEEVSEETKTSEEVKEEDVKDEETKEEKIVEEQPKEKEEKEMVKDTSYYAQKIAEIEQIKDESLKAKLLSDIKQEMGIVETNDSYEEVKVEIKDNNVEELDHVTKMQKYYNSFDPHLYGNDCSSKEYKEMQQKNTVTKKLIDLYLESK